jgi:hypothetical protein
MSVRRQATERCLASRRSIAALVAFFVGQQRMPHFRGTQIKIV